MNRRIVPRILVAAMLGSLVLLVGCGGGRNADSSKAAPAGSLDAGFGDNGVQKSQLDQVSFSGFFAIQPDGKIVATGLSGGGYAVARYNADGSLDTGFGSGGRVTVTPGAGTSTVANKVAVQSTGKIIMVGWADTPAGPAMDILRFLPDGTPDTAWGNPGTLIAPPEANRIISGITVLPDDKVMLAGMDFVNGRGLVIQLNRDGQPIQGFGVNGIVEIPTIPSFTSSTAQRVEVQGDGKIIVAGHGTANGFQLPYSAYILRLNTDGTVDPSFGLDGSVTFGDGWIGGLAITDTGAIVASVVSVELVSGADFSYTRPTTSTIYRFTRSGQADASFGNGGMVANSLDIEDLVMDSGGRITVVGSNESTSEGGIARYLPSGALDTSFGGTGEITLADVQPYYWIAARSNGKVVVAGEFGAGDLIMMQYNP